MANAEYICLAVMSIELDSSLIHTGYLPLERVVRCRDCEHAVEHCDTDLLNCLHFEQWDYYYDQPGEWMVEPDGFCAWGEPRKEEP